MPVREGWTTEAPVGPWSFEALVALDAAVVVVVGLALLPGELDAVDAAVALVDQRHVVDAGRRRRGCRRRVGPDAVDKRREELLAGAPPAARPGQGQSRRGRGRAEPSVHPCMIAPPVVACSVVHVRSPRRFSTGTASRRSFSLAICQSRARPCGSTIRKKMIRPPKMIELEVGRSDRSASAMPSRRGACSRRIGSSTMKAAPRNEPRMLPSPPMMIMNRIWNERSMLERQRLDRAQVDERPQGAGDAAVERADRRRPRAWPCSGRMPMISAAMSMSRIAIQERPISRRASGSWRRAPTRRRRRA